MRRLYGLDYEDHAGFWRKVLKFSQGAPATLPFPSSLSSRRFCRVAPVVPPDESLGLLLKGRGPWTTRLFGVLAVTRLGERRQSITLRSISSLRRALLRYARYTSPRRYIHVELSGAKQHTTAKGTRRMSVTPTDNCPLYHAGINIANA